MLRKYCLNFFVSTVIFLHDMHNLNWCSSSRLKENWAHVCRSGATHPTFVCFVNSRHQPLDGYYLGAPPFYKSKNLNCIGALSFFKDLFTHFHDFWSQIGVVILVTPKQEVERKSEWFCGVKFFHSNFKVEWENGVWTKIRFLASGYFVHMWQVHFGFHGFRFFGSDFFLNGFPNPFRVHTRPKF